jgi:hypothetical protein
MPSSLSSPRGGPTHEPRARATSRLGSRNHGKHRSSKHPRPGAGQESDGSKSNPDALRLALAINFGERLVSAYIPERPESGPRSTRSEENNPVLVSPGPRMASQVYFSSRRPSLGNFNGRQKSVIRRMDDE